MNDIFIFNPTGEMALANGMASYMPPKHLRRFEEDLAFLPSFFASKNDTIITPHLPDADFLQRWHKLGLEAMQYSNTLDLPKKEYNYLRPWSWNPAIHQKTKTLKTYGSPCFKNSPNYNWKQSSRDFFSRETTNKVQQHLYVQNQANSKVTIETPAICISSIEVFEAWFAKQNSAIIKMPWSSSGRGIHIAQPNKGFEVNYPWIKGALKQQGFVTVEPLLDKVFDFSFQLNIKQDGDIDFLGISYFINDNKGHFTGGNIHWPHQQNNISDFLSHDLLHEAKDKLIAALQTVHPHKHYEGPLGVDAIIYKTHAGDLKIHPCLDLNWRFNMGIVNIALPKFVDRHSVGIWKISSFPAGEWNRFIAHNEKTKPPKVHNHKLTSGFINMTPANPNAAFGVWMEVWPREKY